MNSQNSSPNTLRLGQVTRLSFGAIVVVMMGIGISSKYSMNRVVDSSDWVTHTFEVKADLKDLEKQLVDAETGQRGFIFTGQESFLEPYNTSRQEFDATVKDLRALIRDNPEQIERLRKVEELADDKYAELSETIQLKRTKKEKELMAVVTSGKGKQVMDQIRAVLIDMIQEEEKLLGVRQQTTKEAIFQSDVVSLGGTLVAIGVSLGALVIISRQVISPIHRVAEDLASSSADMTSTVQDQESITRHQAAAVQETSTTMDELNVSSRQSAEQAEISVAAARRVMDLAGSGTEAVRHTLADMTIMRNKVEAIADHILQLNEQAQQIASINDVVSNLASQTNMLALNAAVEAVRATENGRGFAVVAAEIRKLADQSKVSADKITVLINEIQKAVATSASAASDGRKTVEQGVRTVQNTADTFVKVADAIHNVVTSSEQISLTARQQAIAIQQVVDVMGMLNQEAVRGAAGISQTRVSAERLNEAVTQLQSVV